MKVKIGKYKSHITPYHLADWLCWWVPDVKDEYGLPTKPDWVHKFGEWLAYGSIEPDPTPENPTRPLFGDRKVTMLYRFLIWICNLRERKISVRIDPWDTWSMDHTLAYIVLPMLKQVREGSHGSPHVEDEDVPEHLRSTSARPLTEEEQNCGGTDEFFHDRWLWVLDEMIFAFESKVDDSWQDQFYSGVSEQISEAVQWDDEGRATLYEMKRGPNDTFTVDSEGMKAYQERISRGFRLFGKYYEGLWT